MAAIQQLLKQVTNLNMQKKYQQVHDILTEQVLEENQHAELYYQAALACENLDEYDDAGDYYEKAFSIDKSMARAYAGAGRVHDAFGENDDAIKMFNAAIKHDPDNAEYYYLIGDLKGRIADAHKEAISDLNKAIKLDPQYAKALQRRGELLFLNKEYEDAKKDFTKAIELQKDLTTAYVLRGLIWHHKKNYNKAISDYDIAIKQNPQDANTWFSRATAWYEKENYDNAIDDISHAIAIKPDDIDLYEFRADCYNDLEEYDLALKDYTAAIRLNFHHKPAWLDMATIFNEQQQYQDPECQYPVVIDIEELGAYYFTIGFVCYHLKDYYEAHVCFNKALWISEYNNKLAETWRTQTKKRIKETPGVYGHRQQVREQAAGFLKELSTQYADKFKTSADGFINDRNISKYDSNNRPLEAGLLGWLPAFRPDIAKWEEIRYNSSYAELKVFTHEGEEFYPHLVGIPINKMLWEEILYYPTDAKGNTIGRVLKFDRVGEMLDEMAKLIKMGRLDNKLIFPDLKDEE